MDIETSFSLGCLPWGLLCWHPGTRHWLLSAGCQLSCAQFEEVSHQMEGSYFYSRWSLGFPAAFVSLLFWLPVWDQHGSKRIVIISQYLLMLFEICYCLCCCWDVHKAKEFATQCTFTVWGLDQNSMPVQPLFLPVMTVTLVNGTSIFGVTSWMHFAVPAPVESTLATKWALGWNDWVSVIRKYAIRHLWLVMSVGLSVSTATNGDLSFTSYCTAVLWPCIMNSFLLQRHEIWDTSLCQKVV